MVQPLHPVVLAIAGSVGNQIGLPVRRMFHVFAEIHKMRGGNIFA